MNRDNMIRMALEAGFGQCPGEGDDETVFLSCAEQIERFASLVALAERNRTWTKDHWTEYERSIAAAEREACAKLCDDLDDDLPDGLAGWQYGEAIRARGQS